VDEDFGPLYDVDVEEIERDVPVDEEPDDVFVLPVETDPPQNIPRKVQRPITGWPIIYYRAQDGNAEGDFMWPLFRYKKKGTLQSWSLRPYIVNAFRDTSSGHKETTIMALFYLIKFHTNPGELLFSIRPLLLKFYWTTVESDSNQKLSKVEINLLWKVLEIVLSKKKKHIALNPWIIQMTAETTSEDCRLSRRDQSSIIVNFLFHLFYYSDQLILDIQTQDPRKRVRKLNIVPLLVFHKKEQNYEQMDDQSLRLSNESTSYTCVFPVFFQTKSPTTHRFHLWPFFGRQTFEREKLIEYSTLYPFFKLTIQQNQDKGKERMLEMEEEAEEVEESDKRMVTPIWLDFMWPLGHYHRSNKINVCRFFPLFYYNKHLGNLTEDRLIVLLNSYWKTVHGAPISNDDMSLGTLFADDDDDEEVYEEMAQKKLLKEVFGIFPLFHVTKEIGHSSVVKNILFLGGSISQTSVSNKITDECVNLWFLLSQYKNYAPLGKKSVLCPVMYWEHSPQTSKLILPVYVYSKSTTKKIIIAPFCIFAEDYNMGRTFKLFFPNMLFVRNPGNPQFRTTIVLPYYYDRDPAGLVHEGIIGMYYYRFNPTYNSLTTYYGLGPVLGYFSYQYPAVESFQGIPLLAMYGNNLASGEKFVISAALLSVFYRSPVTSTDVCVPLGLCRVSSPHIKLFLAFPFFLYSEDVGQPYGTTVIATPFYLDFKARVNDPDLWRRFELKLFPFYARVSTYGRESSLIMWPPVFFYLTIKRDDLSPNEKGNFYISLFPMLVLGFSNNKDLHYLLPFYFSRTTLTSTFFFLPLPFYLDYNRYEFSLKFYTILAMNYEDKNQQLRYLLPFYIEYLNDDVTELILPFFGIYFKDYYNGDYTHIYSIWAVDKKEYTKQKELTYIVPLYYHKKDHKSQTRVIVPFYVHKKKVLSEEIISEDGDVGEIVAESRVVFPIFWQYSKECLCRFC